MPALLDVPPTDHRVIDLLKAQPRELRAVDNDTDERTEPFDPATLSGEGCVLLAVMDTVPGARRRGLGRQLLAALIERGRALGFARLVLETGDLLAEAIHLYESAGFTRIPNCGYYVGMENSLCYELPLGVQAARATL